MILDDLTTAVAVLKWLHDRLTVFFDKVQPALDTPEMAGLHFRSALDADAVWHNLQVADERGRLASELIARLKQAFPGWDDSKLRNRLKQVPSLALLEPEFTPQEQMLLSRLDLGFAIAFVTSTYIVYLGLDPPPKDDLRNRDGSYALPVIELLRKARPRYSPATHQELFQQIREQTPFKEVYNRALEPFTLPSGTVETALTRITFRLLLPYAHVW